MKLKIGAQVVLTRNLKASDQLFNGARGVVVAFKECTPGEIMSSAGTRNTKVGTAFSYVPEVLFDNGERHHIFPVEFSQEFNKNRISRWQVPLKLAWALTIHKSQGMTLDKVENKNFKSLKK